MNTNYSETCKSFSFSGKSSAIPPTTYIQGVHCDMIQSKCIFWAEIVHFLPVFGCLGDSAWNCIPTVYSVVMGLYFFSNQDFSAKGVVKGVCVWGSARDHSRG